MLETSFTNSAEAIVSLLPTLAIIEPLCPHSFAIALNKANFSSLDIVGFSPVVPQTTRPSEPLSNR